MDNNTSIEISTPTGLIAALPGLIGFVPEDSEIFVVLKGEEIVFSARHDFTTAPDVAAHIAAVARSYDATGVLLIAVTDDLAEATHWLDEAGQTAKHNGLRVLRTLHTPSCEVGAQWTDVESGQTGLTEDFRESAVTAARAVTGRAVSTRRDQIQAMFALAEPVDLDTAHTGSPTRFLDIARQVYTLITSNTAPSADLAAQVGRAIIDYTGIRDALIVVGSNAPLPAAQLFATIAAGLRGTVRAEVLTLVAVFSVLGGSGAQANVAIDQAQACATNTPALLDLIEQAIAAGMSPELLRQAIIDPLHKHTYDILGGDYMI
ncbi:DUF4192 domain-containing protein [Williamsia sp.]|uniref:DUF4192 domain-containing protein n=1 Tax=Williamsia sp. TaxID=1872085 RepID=UPI002F95569A